MADQDTLATADRFCAYVHDAISYAHWVTSIATTAAEALAGGRGVCQDVAHAMIALCRAIGLPARTARSTLTATKQIDVALP
jgi:transglutaminase-like putative cysteine protease